MEAVLTGAFLGMLMSSIFIAGGALLLLPYMGAHSPLVRVVAERGAPTRLVVLVVLAFYPTWAAIGAVTGLVYVAFEEGAPGGGLGSPNLAHTLTVIGLALLMATPAAYFARRSARGIFVLAMVFAGIFGWLLPYFAS